MTTIHLGDCSTDCETCRLQCDCQNCRINRNVNDADLNELAFDEFADLFEDRDPFEFI